ncbi:hypothetical protein [Cupriavidus necator]
MNFDGDQTDCGAGLSRTFVQVSASLPTDEKTVQNCSAAPNLEKQSESAGHEMTRGEIARLIELDALHFYLGANDALHALLDILVENAATLSKADLATLTAIGSTLLRAAEAEQGSRASLGPNRGDSRKA